MYGNIVRNNTCTNAGYEGFYLSQFHSALIENNFITGAGKNFDMPHGIYLANSGSKNTIVRGNTIVDSNDIHFNADASVEGADGIISGLVVENNQIWNPPQNGLNMDGVQNSTIRNNLVAGAGNSGLRVYQIDAAAGPKNLNIYNNTFVSARGRWPIKLTDDRGGHVIFNNILLTNASDAGSICTGHRDFQSDFNVTTGRFSFDEEKTTIDLARWRSSGFDATSHVATATELFTAVAPPAYHLSSSAVAVDAGTLTFGGVTAPATDIMGTQRPQRRAIDIGAYELP
jgi:nitrous oxidase accessory protein NosD